MIDYPEGLPYPLRDGSYGFDQVSPTVSTELQSGKSIDRVRFKNTPDIATVSWEFSDSEAQLFMGWFDYTLNSGTLPFNCPLKTPLGFNTYEGKFKGMYQGPTLVGISRWRIQAKVSLFKRPLIGKDWVLYAPKYVLYSNIFDLAVNREWPDA
jgi:hypothetical protein